MSRSRRMHGLSGDLGRILGDAALEQLIGLARLRRGWSDIVGPMMAQRTEPLQFEATSDGRCLWIAVDHSIMAQQIRFLRDDIRKACFRLAGVDRLTHIRTRMVPGAGIRPAPAKPAPRPVSFADKRRLASELAGLKDRRLKRALFRARLAQLSYAGEDAAGT